MDQNYLINFVSGLFGSKREVETPVEFSTYVSDPSGLTGVDRYLRSKEVAPVLSGVERYLKNLEELAAVNEVADSLESQEEVSTVEEAVERLESYEVEATLSSVAKYLAKLDQFPVSGVAKYMARQAISAKKKPRN